METTRTGRVVVGVCRTFAGYQALRYAVVEARRHGQPLIAVHAYRSAGTGPDGLPRTAPADKARQLIDATFAETLGEYPTDVTVRMEVRPGPPGRVLRDVADRPDDLIVIGGSGRWRWTGGRRAVVARACSRAAVCPVVIVPPPALARAASESRLARDTARGLRALLDSVDAPSPARRPRRDER